MATRLMLAVTGCVLALPAAAQTTALLDGRVNKLEREMRAVQRSVFPGGTPVQPELGGGNPSPTIAAGTAATAPVADLTARIGSLERQLATLTGASEQNGFRVRQVEEALARVQARLTTLEAGTASGTLPAGGPSVPAGGSAAEPTMASALETTIAARPTQVARPSATTAARPRTTPAAASNDPGRKAALANIEVPATGDTVEDAYSYGYRLYTAKFYPEAQSKLKDFVAKHSTHRRASYAQNLLGRAYLDEGKPALASVAFYDNYQKMPTGERAPESLYWLGQSLTKLKKLPDACKVYDELTQVYGAKLTADLRSKAAKGRADAKCTA